MFVFFCEVRVVVEKAFADRVFRAISWSVLTYLEKVEERKLEKQVRKEGLRALALSDRFQVETAKASAGKPLFLTC